VIKLKTHREKYPPKMKLKKKPLGKKGKLVLEKEADS